MSLSIHTARDEKGSPAPLSSSSSSSSSTKNESNVVLSLVGNGHSPAVPPEDATVVSFEPNDPENPHNWSFVRHLPPFNGSSHIDPARTLSTNPLAIPPDNQKPHLPNRLPLHHNHLLLLHPTLQFLPKPARGLPGGRPDRPAARASRVAVPGRLHFWPTGLVRLLLTMQCFTPFSNGTTRYPNVLWIDGGPGLPQKP